MELVYLGLCPIHSCNTVNTPKIASTLGTYTTSSSSCLHNIDISNAIETNNINFNKPNPYCRDCAKLNNQFMQWDLFFMF
jgi:hypothetical protein